MKFFYNVNGVAIPSPMEKVVKITTIEGPSCYSKQYKYVVPREKIQLTEDGKGIPAVVDSIYDYGNCRYAKLDVNGQHILINIDDSFNESHVNVYADGSDIEVYQIEIDMRIC